MLSSIRHTSSNCRQDPQEDKDTTILKTYNLVAFAFHFNAIYTVCTLSYLMYTCMDLTKIPIPLAPGKYQTWMFAERPTSLVFLSTPLHRRSSCSHQGRAQMHPEDHVRARQSSHSLRKQQLST